MSGQSESEPKWPEEPLHSKNIEPGPAPEPVKGQSSADTTTQASAARQKTHRRFLSRINPAQIGCGAFIVLAAALVVYLVVKDLILPPGSGIPWTAGTTSIPATPVNPANPSITLLGIGAGGQTYYFDSANGLYYHDAISKTSVVVARLPHFEAFHWSPTRQQIAFVIRDGRDALPLLYVVNLTSLPSDKKAVGVSRRDAAGFPANYGLREESPVVWAPSEDRIAFVAYDEEGSGPLFVAQVPTGTVRQLSASKGIVTSVAWEVYTNTQGARIEHVVYVMWQNGTQYLYSVEADGANSNPWER